MDIRFPNIIYKLFTNGYKIPKYHIQAGLLMDIRFPNIIYKLFANGYTIPKYHIQAVY